MTLFRSLVSVPLKARTVLSIARTPARIFRRSGHDEGPPQPFDNMPFSVHNRYVLTVFFGIFFGIGFWAPFIIVWYSMAKRTF